MLHVAEIFAAEHEKPRPESSRLCIHNTRIYCHSNGKPMLSLLHE
jgi:hypothetical protein